MLISFTVFLMNILILSASASEPYGEELRGTGSYDDYERPASCRQCHTDMYYQWKQSMMGNAFIHHWDEIEYFDLAVEHAKRDPEFADVVDGCNGCHTPLAFIAGDLPPKRPSENTRANESVSCDICHTIPGYNEDVLYNFSYYTKPGRLKYGNRGGTSSPHHDLMKFDGISIAKFCANCHNEKSPWGVYVKGTYNEWLAGPYSKEGVQCQVCHMPRAPGIRAITDNTRYDDVRQHTFQGGHVTSKTSGAIDLIIHADGSEYEPGDVVVFTAVLFNQKAGHKIPTGSVEDRLLHLHVEAVDANGTVYHLPVDRKGFEGEDYTIAADVKAYQDFADMIDVPAGYDGLPRDGVPIGDRIFRMPYFTEDGIMTICQWNTASFGVDYRIGPRETKLETYTWIVPDDIEPGPVTVQARLNYQLLVRPVAEFLDVPEEESALRLISEASTSVEIY